MRFHEVGRSAVPSVEVSSLHGGCLRRTVDERGELMVEGSRHREQKFVGTDALVVMLVDADARVRLLTPSATAVALALFLRGFDPDLVLQGPCV
jgi:hypothetical protein